LFHRGPDGVQEGPVDGFDGPAVESEGEVVLDPMHDADIIVDIAANQLPEDKQEPEVEEVADLLDIDILDGVIVDPDPK